MIELIKTGGTTMIFLLIVSVVSLGFIIEKFISLRFERKRLNNYKRIIEKHNFSISDLSKVLKKDESTSATILKNVLENSSMAKDENTDITRSLLRHEISVLEKGLEIIEISASISPLLGLLGTVIGMIEAFSAISSQGIGDPSVFSHSISKALITTVVGLIVAIPSYAAYLFFSKKVEDIVAETDKYATILTTSLYGKKNV
ncbi:MAG: MotA/TolQ/ExbB proton channel family protein [Candidatus Aureabacteria bacterium]|nr:MotA/TolQ/ExbB proton channel family protein [Candidatus Auribacterota bacterium]